MKIGALTVACVPIWRESYAPIILARKAKRLGLQPSPSTTTSGLAKFNSTGRAVLMLVYSPIILALAVWMGLIYAYFFLLIATLTPVFQENYHFTDSTVGLSYLGLAVGFELGQVLFAWVSDKLVKQLAKKTASGEMKPEYRLLPSIVGGITTPVALFWYGWSVQARVHWMAPIIGSAFLGIGNSLIFVSSSVLTPWIYC